jgi:hypothetical protein
MENHCIYHPEAGPEGETGAGGLCPDCMDEGYVSYFCSQACYSGNLVSIFFGFGFCSLQVKWRINGTCIGGTPRDVPLWERDQQRF